jgi:hypothetical protein
MPGGLGEDLVKADPVGLEHVVNRPRSISSIHIETRPQKAENDLACPHSIDETGAVMLRAG